MYPMIIVVSLLAAQPSENRPEPVAQKNHVHSHYANYNYHVPSILDWTYHGPAFQQIHPDGHSKLNRYPTFCQRQYFEPYNYRNIMDYPWHEDLYPYRKGGYCEPTIYSLPTPSAEAEEIYNGPVLTQRRFGVTTGQFSVKRTGQSQRSFSNQRKATKSSPLQITASNSHLE